MGNIIEKVEIKKGKKADRLTGESILKKKRDIRGWPGNARHF